jgi:hypothetical protein
MPLSSRSTAETPERRYLGFNFLLLTSLFSLVSVVLIFTCPLPAERRTLYGYFSPSTIAISPAVRP